MLSFDSFFFPFSGELDAPSWRDYILPEGQTKSSTLYLKCHRQYLDLCDATRSNRFPNKVMGNFPFVGMRKTNFAIISFYSAQRRPTLSRIYWQTENVFHVPQQYLVTYSPNIFLKKWTKSSIFLHIIRRIDRGTQGNIYIYGYSFKQSSSSRCFTRLCGSLRPSDANNKPFYVAWKTFQIELATVLWFPPLNINCLIRSSPEWSAQWRSSIILFPAILWHSIVLIKQAHHDPSIWRLLDCW